MKVFNILIPGSFFIGKDLDLSLESVAQMVEDLRPNKRELNITIIEDLEYKVDLLTKLKFNGIQKFCKVIHADDHAAIDSVYINSDVIILPQANCKISMIKESLSMNVIPICFEFDGINEYMDRTSGILITPSSKENNRNAIAEALTMLKDDHEAIHMLKEGTKRKYQNAFCWGRASEKKRRSSAT